jgi:hypothetical protein
MYKLVDRLVLFQAYSAEVALATKAGRTKSSHTFVPTKVAKCSGRIKNWTETKAKKTAPKNDKRPSFLFFKEIRVKLRLDSIFLAYSFICLCCTPT